MRTATAERPPETIISVPKDQLQALIATAERVALGTLGLHGILVEQGHEPQARIEWMNHMGAYELAQALGKLAGVEVDCE